MDITKTETKIIAAVTSFVKSTPFSDCRYRKFKTARIKDRERRRSVIRGNRRSGSDGWQSASYVGCSGYDAGYSDSVLSVSHF